MDFITAAFNLQKPGLHNRNRQDHLRDISYFLLENKKYLNSHYYLELYKLIIYPEEISDMKLAAFTKDQLHQ